MSGGRSTWIVRALVFIALCLVTSVAAAAGRVQWSKTTIKETDSKSWKLELKIFLTKAPDVAHIPMKFEFEPLAYYERSMIDGKDEPQERRVPLTGRQDIIEGVEVGFLDPGTGKTAKGTAFTFKVTRSHGFEAGEYKVTIRDARNGGVVGTPTTLKFEGENEVIDRRTMTFADPGSKKKKKEGEEAKEGEDKKDGEEAKEGEETSEEPAAEETPANEEPPADEPEKTGEVKEKPGGCGCRVEGKSRVLDPALAPLLLGLLAFSLRRRRRAR
jgi:MYXO-CTERM domain-containing protein